MSGRGPTSAAFEPTRLAPRRRRVDPVVLGAVAVVIAVGAAVVKPWASAAPAGSVAGASPRAVVASEGPPATAAPAASAAMGGPGTTTRVVSMTWGRVASALRDHAAWGVRAVVRAPSTPRDVEVLVERWAEIDPTGPDDAAVLLPTADQGVLALGITFPPDALPLEARIWRERDGGWEWLHAPALEPSPASGAFLFGPPRIGGSTAETWPTGSYRIQVLTGSAVLDLRVDLPDRFEVVPGPPVAGAAGDSRSPFDPEFRQMDPGRPFVVRDGIANATLGGPSGPLDPVAAWLDAEPTAGQAATLDRVASIYAPGATGLGVLLPIGASEVDAAIRAIAPDDGPVAAQRWIGSHLTDVGRSPYVVFRPTGAAAWSAGLYRLDVTWTDRVDGRTSASYHTELRPGPGTGVAEPLAALRALAPAAGGSAVLGIGGDLIGRDDLACGSAGGPSDPPMVIGIAHAPGGVTGDIVVERLLGAARTAALPVLVTPEPVPGLTLLAPGRSDRFAPGVYRITAHDGGETRTRTVCVGTADPD